MIRTIRSGACALSLVAAAALLAAPLAPAHAQEGKGKAEAKSKAGAQTGKAQAAGKAKDKDKASDKAKARGKEKGEAGSAAAKGSARGAKPVPVTTSGDWGVFTTQGGKSKTCYVLAKPSARAPAALKRDPAYVFISTRPAENVRNEVSIIMGFAMKAGGDARADIGGVTFELAPQGSNAWLRNLAEQDRFLDALRKGSKMTVRAASAKGNVTTDTYSLSGLSGALDRLGKECP
jgi:invasion protein IalB